MQKEILEFINENLSLFNGKTRLRSSGSIFKTADGKLVHSRAMEKIAKEFVFEETENLLNLFSFTDNIDEIKKRQGFFKSLALSENDFLKILEKPRAIWKPKYEVVVVTEDEASFIDLQKLGCPVKFITNENDLTELESCDVVQVLDCENFSLALESLAQSVILNDSEEAYLERYVEQLSGWRKNIEILMNNISSEEIKRIAEELFPLLKLADEKTIERITKEQIERELEEINERISERIKNLSLSGEALMQILNKKLPKEIEELVESEIKNSKIPEHLLSVSIPVSLDEQEVDRFLKNQQAEEHTSIAENIKKNSRILREVPEKLKLLENYIIYYDFISGISKFIDKNSFPEISQELSIENSKNIFLFNPQAVSFKLDETFKCSILTGANSGGKTTLLEHILQLISLSNIGLAVSGRVKLPIFSEVYYFAKNKGSMSKGAFETLLTQMSEIKTGKQTLILADEMEAVTEPGVAGKIVNATAEYFINKNCFVIIATHLGQEIIKHLPEKARVDGIEAKGLDENFELIIEDRKR